jgi:hypothetical protein
MDKYIKRVIIGLDEYGIMFDGFKQGNHAVYKLSDHAESEMVFNGSYVDCIAYLNDLMVLYLENSI